MGVGWPPSAGPAAAREDVRRMSLLTRVFLANAAVLATITLLLLFSPIEISYPVTETQSVILVTGFVVSLVVNLVLLRRGRRARCGA